MAVPVEQIKDVSLFTAMDSTAEELKDTCREAFCIDSAKHGFTHKRDWAKVHNAWLSAKVNVDVKTKVDAVSRAHGQPITFFTADWARLVVQFTLQYWMSIYDATLPSQNYYESFQERLKRKRWLMQ